MTAASRVGLKVGAALPERRFGPQTLTDIVRYQGASGDFNPVHHDDKFARSAGMPGVFSVGMLQAGYLGTYCVDLFGAESVRRLSVRFAEQVWPGDELVCRGVVSSLEPTTDGHTAELDLTIARTRGGVAVSASATIALEATADDSERTPNDDTVTAQVLPVADYLVLGERPHLTGFRCADCGAVYLLRRSACARCGGAEFGDRSDLGDSGVVIAATVVHRAPPGVPTPFVSGVVALDAGGFVRTNLTGVLDDPVTAVGRTAVMRTRPLATDSRGVEAIGYEFEVQEQL